MSAAPEAPAALTRRERRRLEVRERILETATAVFEECGYEATTVGDIAERADIAYGTFFNHFPTKLDLLRVLADRTLQQLYANVEQERREPGTFAEHVERVFARAGERATVMGPRARDLIGAMLTLAYPETAVSDDLRMRQIFRELLEEGLARGELREDEDVETLIEIVVGTWYSLFLSWVHVDDYPLEARARATGRFLARTLSKGA